MPSFSDLLEIHRELDACFAEHQYALLHFEFVRAGDLLRTYEAKLLAHMSFEEDVLLPIYGRAETDRGGEAKLFLDEHEKMKNFIQMFFEALGELSRTNTPEPMLLKLLDREFFYLKLCSHHDNREAKYLYPGLDAVTSETEKTRLLMS
jgi:hypothetical protein